MQNKRTKLWLTIGILLFGSCTSYFAAIQLEFVRNPLIRVDCGWHTTVYAWVDVNGNQVWDPQELPLPYVEYQVHDVTDNPAKLSMVTTGNSEGEALIDLFFAGCPKVKHVVEALPPQAYVATTEVAQRLNQGPLYFGFALDPMAVTPTPRPEPDLSCESVQTDSFTLYGFSVAPDGSVWARGPETQRFGQTGESRLFPMVLPNDLNSGSIAFQDDKVWVGHWSSSNPLYLFDGNNWHKLGEAFGVTEAQILDIAVLDNGSVWLATANGLFWASSVPNIIEELHFELVEGLNHTSYQYMTVASDSSLWMMARDHELVRLSQSEATLEIETVPLAVEVMDGLNGVFTIEADSETSLWIGAINGIAQYDWHNKQWSRIDSMTTNRALPTIQLSDLAVGADGQLWLGTYRHGVVSFEPGEISHQPTFWTIHEDERLVSDSGTRIMAHPDGSIWAGLLSGKSIVRCVK